MLVSIMLALLASLLLALAFPSPDIGFFAWVALVPLIRACAGRSPAVSFLLGLLFGTAFTIGTYGWVFKAPGVRVYHFIPAMLYLALYPAAWVSLLAILRRSGNISLLYAPSLWVALDFLKAHAGFLSLPWATLAHSQHHDIAGIQIASITGEYGVTFLVVLANMAVHEVLIRRNVRRGIIAMASILLVHLWGFYEMSGPDQGASVKVAVVQPVIEPSERANSARMEASLVHLEEMTRHAAESLPALVVWPETSVRALDMDIALYKRLYALAEEIKTPLIVGSSDYSKMLVKKTSPQDKRYQFNSAYCLLPGMQLGTPYRKRLLVPFGEYLPLASTIRWPRWFIPDYVETRPGTENKPFTLTNGVRFSTIICWENLFSDYVRTLVESKSRLLLQLTNDAWFEKTAAPNQHNLASVLRAVENRIPIVIASNAGPSLVIDQHGRVLAEIPLFRPGFLSAELIIKTETTVYTTYGDLFALMSIAVSLCGLSLRLLHHVMKY